MTGHGISALQVIYLSPGVTDRVNAGRSLKYYTINCEKLDTPLLMASDDCDCLYSYLFSNYRETPPQSTV